MLIETIDLPELVAIGLEVEAEWSVLAELVPAAWARLFARETGATAFLEVSTRQADGRYRELVGFLAAGTTEVPDGLVRRVIPPGRYLRLVHDGPLAGIADGFGSLERYAALHGLTATGLKLDFGYRPGLPPGRHELHLAIEPESLRLA